MDDAQERTGWARADHGRDGEVDQGRSTPSGAGMAVAAASLAGIREAAAEGRGQGHVARGEVVRQVAPVVVGDAREARIIAFLEEVVNGRFVYQDGRAQVVRDEDAVYAENQTLAAYALRMEVLLERGQTPGGREREKTRPTYRSRPSGHSWTIGRMAWPAIVRCTTRLL